MKFLVLLHVLSAIIGVGPTFFIHALFGKKENVGELRSAFKLGSKLELFPKIGGSIAVITGLILVFADGWKFVSFWIIGSLVLYVAIQVLVIGFASPVTKRLGKLIAETKLTSDQAVPDEQKQLLARANKLYYGATAMGTLLFILMILKPFY
ncbi:putative integral membrane protein DUF2269 [Paenibacillus taihuensis]|uniref:Putative integral membrane protein DUF2269 n=1 Tax=Paenibacillus taihuensis TaxID=1156355 RepID=A0A3D9RIG6_9BACL|nr:DUF2269 family protein [Paenibacillus taihuensis]REE78756.1 putative integral membrane protein DUF2269 [Paenibacillus taihuensis]